MLALPVCSGHPICVIVRASINANPSEKSSIRATLTLLTVILEMMGIAILSLKIHFLMKYIIAALDEDKVKV